MLFKQFEVGEMNIFSYLVADDQTKEALFIDPAAEQDRLMKEVAAHGLNVKYIVNTHHHIDHSMGNKEMVQRTGAKIVIHELDAPELRMTPPEMLRMFRAEASPPPDVLVSDGQIISVGNIALKVLHTPGHTPGGMCLYMDGIVFTGDTLFVGSIGRTDFPGGSYDQLENSIRTRLYTLPGDTVVYPGHNYGMRPSSTIDLERRTNAFVRG